MRDLGTDSMSARGVDTIRTLSGTRLLTDAGDTAKLALLARGVTELAHMFTAPNSVELLRQAAARGCLAPYAEAGGRAGAIGAAGTGGRQKAAFPRRLASLPFKLGPHLPLKPGISHPLSHLFCHYFLSLWAPGLRPSPLDRLQANGLNVSIEVVA